MRDLQIIRKNKLINYLCLNCEYRFKKPYFSHKFDGITMIRKAHCPKCDSQKIKKIKIGFKTLF